MTTRRVRPWLKQRLGDNEDAEQAIKIWKRWKRAKLGAQNVARAIRLYGALLKGDGAEFHKLMVEYFPGYGLSLGGAVSQPERPARNNNSHPKPIPAQIVISNEAYNDPADEDDMGFSNLEIN